MLRLGRVTLGKRCFVGPFGPGLDCRMEDGSRLDDQSLLADGETLRLGESARGAPARTVGSATPIRLPGGLARPAPRRRVRFALLQLGLAELLAVLLALPAFAYAAGLYASYARAGIAGFALAAVISVPFGIAGSALYVAALKRLILPRRGAGGVRRRKPLLRAQVAERRLDARHPRARCCSRCTRRSTCRPGCGFMGAKIGPRAELSTVWNFRAGAHRRRRGELLRRRLDHRRPPCAPRRFEISVNRIGRRSFVGNSAVLPVGSEPGRRLPAGRAVGSSARTGPHPRRLRMARLALVRAYAPAEGRRLRGHRHLPPDAQALPPAGRNRRPADRDPRTSPSRPGRLGLHGGRAFVRLGPVAHAGLAPSGGGRLGAMALCRSAR